MNTPELGEWIEVSYRVSGWREIASSKIERYTIEQADLVCRAVGCVIKWSDGLCMLERNDSPYHAIPITIIIAWRYHDEP